jgi:hypothetical protein
MSLWSTLASRVFSTLTPGFVPKATEPVGTKFLRDDGTWQVVAGTGLADGDKGDITVSGSGTNWTIDNGAVTLAKQANLPANTIVGNNTAAAAPPQALNYAQVVEIINTALGGTSWQSGGSGTPTFASIIGAATDNANLADELSDRQPLDADLTAIAALVTTAFGRGLLTLADGPALASTHSHSGGSAAWGGITGTLSAQTDLQTALDAKATILAPVTLSANTNLTASAHGNRLLLVDTAGLTLTINNDATGGWTADDSLDIQAVGAGTFTLVQGSATLTTDSGTSAASATAIGKRVQAQRSGANDWRTISSAIPSGGSASSVSYGSVGPSSVVLPERNASTVLANLGALSGTVGTATARTLTDTPLGRFPRVGYVGAAAINTLVRAGHENTSGGRVLMGGGGYWRALVIGAVSDASSLGSFAMGVWANSALAGTPIRTSGGDDFGLWRCLLGANEGSAQLVVGWGDPADGAMETTTLNGGSGFTARSGDPFSFELAYFPTSAPGGRRIEWVATNLSSELSVTGTITTRLPASATLGLSPAVARDSRTEAAIAPAIDFIVSATGSFTRTLL